MPRYNSHGTKSSFFDISYSKYPHYEYLWNTQNLRLCYIKKNILIIKLIIFLLVCTAEAQIVDSLYTEKEVQKAIQKMIEKKDHIDTAQTTKLLFSFKIDSLGEVHSVHIIKASNLKFNSMFRICREIEDSFNLKYFYDKYKNMERFRVYFYNQKYVRINISYFSERDY